MIIGVKYFNDLFSFYLLYRFYAYFLFVCCQLILIADNIDTRR